MDVNALAALAGNTLVTAMATDAWESARHRIARWSGRGQPDAKILERLDQTSAELGAAPLAPVNYLSRSVPGADMTESSRRRCVRRCAQDRPAGSGQVLAGCGGLRSGAATFVLIRYLSPEWLGRAWSMDCS